MTRIDIGWTHPKTEEEYRVTLDVILPRRSRGWTDPGDPGEVEVIAVREDAPGGASRPDLIEEVERDFDTIEYRAIEAAEDAFEDDAAAADDDRYEAARERRMGW